MGEGQKEDEGLADAGSAVCLQCVHSSWEAPTRIRTGT
ncbi:hypothetical protein Q9966_010592 [Columba livia]|nr:hypothetical protein Q9966_010592 [Columba livia]